MAPEKRKGSDDAQTSSVVSTSSRSAVVKVMLQDACDACTRAKILPTVHVNVCDFLLLPASGLLFLQVVSQHPTLKNHCLATTAGTHEIARDADAQRLSDLQAPLGIVGIWMLLDMCFNLVEWASGRLYLRQSSSNSVRRHRTPRSHGCSMRSCREVSTMRPKAEEFAGQPLWYYVLNKAMFPFTKLVRTLHLCKF